MELPRLYSPLNTCTKTIITHKKYSELDRRSTAKLSEPLDDTKLIARRSIILPLSRGQIRLAVSACCNVENPVSNAGKKVTLLWKEMYLFIIYKKSYLPGRRNVQESVSNFCLNIICSLTVAASLIKAFFFETPLCVFLIFLSPYVQYSKTPLATSFLLPLARGVFFPAGVTSSSSWRRSQRVLASSPKEKKKKRSFS